MSEINKKLTIGILADVDAGKTTISEAMLYLAGAVRSRGRVDDGSTFLDTHELERARGITIFSKQAVFEYGGTRFYLLDTPGHADFTAETERAAMVLDHAVMLINGSDGVTAHALSLWKTLRSRNVPTFIFVNKTDLAGFDKAAVMQNLTRRLGDAVVDFDAAPDEIAEEAAVCDEQLLEVFDRTGSIPESELAAAVARCSVFPCIFGSALRSDGVDKLLGMLCGLTRRPHYGDTFSAKVYKIERDSEGKRMTVMKLTGGSLSVRDVIRYRAADGSYIEEKAARIRIYSGGRANELRTAEAGDVIAVPGLTATYAGMTIGGTEETPEVSGEASICCAVYPPEGCDSYTLLMKLRELREEDPSLCVHFNEKTQETEVSLSGELRTEVLRHEIKRRYGLDVTFGSGRVLYKETIGAPVEGVGHFEPLRHYAEVHLVLTPLPEGSGIVYDSAVPEDRLDRSWQNLILSSLKAKEHIGVLTGSPITDMRITLTAGRAHTKHTEGGDFREASWRALRQGLMKARNILLEPFYSFALRVPAAQVGRALTDLDAMHAEFSQPEPDGDMQLITGKAPAVRLKSYAADVAAYTRGSGSIYTEPAGYFPCINDKEVIAEIGYDPCADLENTPDSVFCSHGSGDVVNWAEVEKYMHLPATLADDKPVPVSAERSRKISLGDDELRRIMQKIAPEKEKTSDEEESRRSREKAKAAAAKSVKPDTRPRLLLVDGYNIIFAWEQLRGLAGVNIDSACAKLADILSNYAGFKGIDVMLVFDAYKTPAVTPHKVTADSIEVVYTRSGQTSDAFIESFCSENRKKLRIKVASSDGMVQMSVMRCGALRMSARELELEVARTEALITEIISAD